MISRRSRTKDLAHRVGLVHIPGTIPLNRSTLIYKPVDSAKLSGRLLGWYLAEATTTFLQTCMASLGCQKSLINHKQCAAARFSFDTNPFFLDRLAIQSLDMVSFFVACHYELRILRD